MIIPFKYNQETKTFSWFGKKKRDNTESSYQIKGKRLVEEIINKALSDPRYKKYTNEVSKLNNGNVFIFEISSWKEYLLSALDWIHKGYSEYKIWLNYIPVASDEDEWETLLMNIKSGNLYHTRSYHEFDTNLIRVTSIKNWIKSVPPPYEL